MKNTYIPVQIAEWAHTLNLEIGAFDFNANSRRESSDIQDVIHVLYDKVIAMIVSRGT